MRRRLLALFAAMLMSLAATLPATAITKNFVKDFEHPFVGLIAFYDDDGEFVHRCSGSLLNTRVFLTAGHCTDDGEGGVNASARVWFRQDAGSRFNGTTVPVDPLTGYPETCIDDPNVALDACVTAHTMFNYGFDDFAGFPDIRDVGVVILDAPVNLPEYASIAAARTLDALATSRGTQDVTFTVSGYGVSHSAKHGAVTVSFRERLMAISILTNLRSALVGGVGLQTNGNGAGRGGTCGGDSGGPVFWPSNTNQIVAVTSWGFSNAGCRGTDFAYRVDRPEVIAWIDQVAGNLWNP